MTLDPPSQPNHLRRLAILTALVRRVVRPPVDHEHIATTLWLREYTDNRTVSMTEIRNLCYDHLRRIQVNQKFAESIQRAQVNATVERTVCESYDITAYMDRLSAIERKIIWYTFWEGKTNREIAELMCFQEQLVTDIRRRALGILKTHAINNETEIT